MDVSGWQIKVLDAAEALHKANDYLEVLANNWKVANTPNDKALARSRYFDQLRAIEERRNALLDAVIQP